MLPRSFTLTDTTPYIASASHVYALTLPWGPTCPPLGPTSSISENTSNAGDKHDA